MDEMIYDKIVTVVLKSGNATEGEIVEVLNPVINDSKELTEILIDVLDREGLTYDDRPLPP